MNNILFEKLPQTLNIGGAEVEINSDFRTFLQYEKVLSDSNLEDSERLNKILDLVYPVLRETTDNSNSDQIKLYKCVLENIKEAIEKMQWFYRCGKDEESKKEIKGKIKDVYSFEHDADLIYSAFLDQYGVDLQETDLHWWKFKAMFNSLKEDNEIYKRMSIRSVDVTKVPKEQQEYYKKMQKIYEIPRDKEEVEQNSSLAALLRKGKTLDDLE